MRKLFAVFTLSAFIFSSCEKATPIGETASLRINFKAVFEGELLEFGKPYPYQTGHISFNQFSFYASDVAIMGQNTGFENELFEIHLINFVPEEASATDFSEVLKRTFQNIPTGEYSGFGMGVGVNSELNATTPTDYSGTHPLGQSELFWDVLKSYVFTNISGEIDLDGDGVSDRPFSIRAGTDELFQKLTIPIQLNLSANQTRGLTFAFDLRKLFEQQGSDLVNISEIPEDIDESNLNFAKNIMQRFPSAVSLE